MWPKDIIKMDICRKLIVVTGPSACGKTFFANKLLKKIGKNRCSIISQDNYYKDWGNLDIEKRKKINFDDIKAFDLSLFKKHLQALKDGKSILRPYYDFVRSARLKKTKRIYPKPVIIVEGLMPLAKRSLINFFDFKIYIEADNATCLARRIKRDTRERGDSIESACRRYFQDVLPMQKKYVEPQKKLADIVIDTDKKLDDRLWDGIIKHII
ncbi:MAG: uridine kinase [Candidatus Omnitrophota bacterium]